MADGPGKWRRNEDSPHILCFSGCPIIHCQLTRLEASKVKELHPFLGNLNTSFIVRTSRGLPFNAPYACTDMHRLSITVLLLLILSITTNHSLTQPRGELLLALPTLLTTHHVNAEGNKSAKEP